MKTLPEIKAEVDGLAARIGAADNVLPTYGHSEDGARPHVEVDFSGYHYVTVERGQELERLTTNDFGELLFYIFRNAAFSLACAYEREHRVENQDFRRILFRRQIELLATLFPHWGDRESRRHAEILQKTSF